jgi:hypothetical protein
LTDGGFAAYTSSISCLSESNLLAMPNPSVAANPLRAQADPFMQSERNGPGRSEPEGESRSAWNAHLPSAGPDPGESLGVGGAILKEFHGVAGAVVYRILSEVHLRAGRASPEQSGPFADPALPSMLSMLPHIPLDPGLRTLLTRLGKLLLEKAPVDAALVVAACREIARRAEECGAIATARAFSQAADAVGGRAHGESG